MNLKDFKDSKDKLRKLCRENRRNFCASVDKHIVDHQLSEKILSVLPSHSQNFWGSYMAFKSEANPSGACKGTLNWVYPVIAGELLRFYSAKENQGQWDENQFGILEPRTQGDKFVPLAKIEGIFIPGLAFDRKGYRLGSGFGFYDKTLTDFIGLKIGVCYSNQLVDEDLPRECHDIPVDMIVTEKEVFNLKERFEL